MLPTDLMMIIVPLILAVVGLCIMVFPKSFGFPWPPALVRLFGLAFTSIAGLVLFIGLWQTISRSEKLAQIHQLSAEAVVTIDIGPYSIADRSQIAPIVDALREAKPYAPNHGNYADKVVMSVHRSNGSSLSFLVAQLDDEPGGIINFPSIGDAESTALPAALANVGYELPQFRGDRFLRGLKADEVQYVEVDGIVVRDQSVIGHLLKVFHEATLDVSCDTSSLGRLTRITLVQKGNRRTEMQAGAGGRGEMVFWFRTPDAKHPIDHGHSSSSDLSDILQSIGASANQTSRPEG